MHFRERRCVRTIRTKLLYVYDSSYFIVGAVYTEHSTGAKNKIQQHHNISVISLHVQCTASRDSHIQYLLLTNIHRVPPKKTCDYIFYNNLNNKCPITIIFGIVSGKPTCHRKMVSFPISPI